MDRMSDGKTADLHRADRIVNVCMHIKYSVFDFCS